MLRIIITILFIAFSIGACANTQIPPVAQGLLDCGETALRNEANNLIPAVTTALATGNYEAELVKLLDHASAEALDCAVAFVGSQSAGDARAVATDLNARDRAARAAAWLTKRGRTIRPAGA